MRPFTGGIINVLEHSLVNLLQSIGPVKDSFLLPDSQQIVDSGPPPMWVTRESKGIDGIDEDHLAQFARQREEVCWFDSGLRHFVSCV